MIELRLVTGSPVECGDTVAVSVTWTDLDRTVRELRVSASASVLVGDESDEIADSVVTVGVPADRPEGTEAIDLTIPVAGPVSHRGELFAVDWRLGVVVDLRRARDTYVQGPAFEVIPSGSRLHAALELADPPGPDPVVDPPE